AQPAPLSLEDAALVPAGGLGEGQPAVGQRDLVVGPLMLRPGRADVAYRGAGDPLQPPGELGDPPGEPGGPGRRLPVSRAGIRRPVAFGRVVRGRVVRGYVVR